MEGRESKSKRGEGGRKGIDGREGSDRVGGKGGER